MYVSHTTHKNINIVLVTTCKKLFNVLKSRSPSGWVIFLWPGADLKKEGSKIDGDARGQVAVMASKTPKKRNRPVRKLPQTCGFIYDVCDVDKTVPTKVLYKVSVVMHE